jgi:hypothetical protein
MDFWTELIGRGIIEGNPAHYNQRLLADWEYGHAIQVAFSNTAPGSAERTFLNNSLPWNRSEFAGDPNHWINLPADSTEVQDLRNAAVRHFSANPQLTIGGDFAPGPVSSEPLVPPTAPSVPTIPQPTPSAPAPSTPAFDYEGAAKLIAPWLPDALVAVFASAWAQYGDPDIALAAVRQDASYDSYFPGIKRPDRSLRMTEQEYMAQRDAYSILLLEYGINPAIFENRFTNLIAGDVSADEFATRLESAYTQIVSNFDQVRQIYSQYYGIEMTNEAIFASFIDEDVSQAILDRRIAVAQVGGAAAVQGLGLTANYAERLVNAGLSQSEALNFFGRAANQLPTLSRLATRYNDPDSSVDVTEFADFGIFQDPTQTARFRRLLAAETSSFTAQEFARFGQSGTIEGLEQR